MRAPGFGMAVAALAITLLAASATASAQAPPQDSVVASGSTLMFSNFDIAVTSGPNGENPTGHSFVTLGGETFRSDTITCLAVSGNTAVVGGSLQPNSIGFVGFINTLVDNGPFGDLFTANSRNVPPTICPAPEFGSQLLSGEVTVVDATPLPTNTDECKDGGWQSYGVFKNQGACVSSFVSNKNAAKK